VKQAAEQWLTTAEIEKLERSTLDHYRTHVIKHIVPKIGASKLATLTTPQINVFRDTLLSELSRPMGRKVLASFRSIIKDARRREPSRITWPRVSPLVPTSARSDVWKSVAIFLGQMKSAVS
jgi:hypothetical protein